MKKKMTMIVMALAPLSGIAQTVLSVVHTVPDGDNVLTECMVVVIVLLGVTWLFNKSK